MKIYHFYYIPNDELEKISLKRFTPMIFELTGETTNEYKYKHCIDNEPEKCILKWHIDRVYSAGCGKCAMFSLSNDEINFLNKVIEYKKNELKRCKKNDELKKEIKKLEELKDENIHPLWS